MAAQICGDRHAKPDLGKIRMPNFDLLPCPVCGIVIGNPEPDTDNISVIRDPALTTPYARLAAAAAKADIIVNGIPSNDIAGLGAAITFGADSEGNIAGIVFLADDLNDDLRTDILAFCMSTILQYLTGIKAIPRDHIGVFRDPIPPAPEGASHLAWHLLRSCGRESPSTNFGHFDLQSSTQPD